VTVLSAQELMNSFPDFALSFIDSDLAANQVEWNMFRFKKNVYR
jgi:hypothetical protein